MVESMTMMQRTAKHHSKQRPDALTAPTMLLCSARVPRGAPEGAEIPLHGDRHFVVRRRGDPSNLIRVMPAKGQGLVHAISPILNRPAQMRVKQ